jgi:ATP-dependent RNA helicase DeaD
MTEQTAPPSFAELGLSPAVVAALTDVGYETPTPIQAQTIPLLLAGSDLLGQASTGTGKTAAFALPILSQIDTSIAAPQALVLCPTRELAIQVAEAFQKYATKIPGFHVLPIYGGQSYTPQLKGLKRGAHVIVGTPGRLLDHVNSGALKLDQLKTLVLDEGDEMLQMGFADAIEALLSQTPADKQVALFTATLPHAIRRIAQTHMRDPREIAIQSRGASALKIRQRYWLVSGLHKLDALTRLLEAEKFEAVLVFVRTKIETVDLAQRLEARGFAASALNGDMEQRTREQTVQRLKDGKIDILIATDVAARGLDVERISHVLNYDIPYDAETYVHRIGRTGRAGRSGDAILFVSPRERNMLRIIERVTQQRIEEMKMPSVADMNELRVVKFKEKITAAVLSGAGQEFRSILEQIETDGNVPAMEIAAALASMVQGSTPLFLAQKAESAPKAPPNIDGSVPTSIYRIAVGHEHGVLPGNIVGCIANEANLEGRHIGHIDIREDHSYVELPTLPDEMIDQLRTVRVRGEELRIERVDSKPEKPKFSGKSRRPDRVTQEFRHSGPREDRLPQEFRRPESGERSPADKGREWRDQRKSQYEGTPRFANQDAPPPGDASQRFEGYASAGRPAPRSRDDAGGPTGSDRPRFDRGAPRKEFKPAGTGFKKKYVGKAAGAKGSFKPGAFKKKFKSSKAD